MARKPRVDRRLRAERRVDGAKGGHRRPQGRKRGQYRKGHVTDEQPKVFNGKRLHDINMSTSTSMGKYARLCSAHSCSERLRASPEHVPSASSVRDGQVAPVTSPPSRACSAHSCSERLHASPELVPSESSVRDGGVAPVTSPPSRACSAHSCSERLRASPELDPSVSSVRDVEPAPVTPIQAHGRYFYTPIVHARPRPAPVPFDCFILEEWRSKDNFYVNSRGEWLYMTKGCGLVESALSPGPDRLVRKPLYFDKLEAINDENRYAPIGSLYPLF